MYNPINMKIEDEERLYEKDLREKNKKKRYEVKYDVETYMRKNGLAEQDREKQMTLNKFAQNQDQAQREQIERGFDIITNGNFEKSKTQLKKQAGVWSKALNTVNSGFMSEQDVKRVEDELNEKQRAQERDFHSTQLEELKRRAGDTQIEGMKIQNRSKRVGKEPLQELAYKPTDSKRSQIRTGGF